MPYCHECPTKKQKECDKNYSDMKPLDCHMKERRNVKPCPFCGSNHIDVMPLDRGVQCDECGAFVPSRVSTDITRNQVALEMWNTRKEPKDEA
jgi:hypothetical protein